MIGTKQGITYFSDCKNISSITNPIIDNNVYMRLSGFLSNNWKQEDINFDTIGYGLYRDLSTKGTIWCNDASKLFTVNGTMNQGYIGITLSFPYAITNGVHELISDNKYFIFGTNVGIYDIKSPGFSLFLTKNGFEYTIMTSAGKFTMIDSYSTFSANEDIFIEFFWDKNHIYEAYDNCNVIVKANGVAVIGGNTPIHEDSLVGYKFYCLDTPVLSSTLKCTIKNLICYNTVPEYVDNLEYSSSSSSDMFSSSSRSSSSTENIPVILKNWNKISISSNGSVMAATEYGNVFNYIYTSNNYGQNWEQRDFGTYVTMSNTGENMYATHYGSYNMKKSINSGLTWSNIPLSVDSYVYITSSSDGTKLVASSYIDLYLSTDSGTNWSAPYRPDGISPISDLDMSSSGAVIALCNLVGHAIVSTNYGNSWTVLNLAGGASLNSITISSDGLKIITCGNDGNIYISSNSGTSWSTVSFVGNCTTITSSSNGQYLAMGVYNNYIYTSFDFGNTWNARISSGQKAWKSIASSSTGQYIAACEEYGSIYVSTNYGATWNQSRIR